MSYQKKYLKYKNKYLNLKKQTAGKINNESLSGEIYLESIEAVPSSPSIYCMSGHSCDSLELRDVPPNCIYITFGLCGSATAVDNNHYKFIDMFKNNHIYLQNPIKYLPKLHEIFNYNIHIHYSEAKDPEMRKYVNSKYTPLLNFKIKHENIEIHKSGLYSIGSNLLGKITNIKDTITKDNIKFLYENSLYPTTDYIINNIFTNSNISYSNLNKYIDELLTIDQETLFKYYPGIYYNFSCRVDCNNHTPKSIDFIKMRRQQSYTGNLIEREIPIIDEKNSIHNYLKQKNFNKVKELIISGANLDEINEDGVTPLHVCCDKEYYDLANLLIDNGANIDKAYNKCFGTKNREFWERLVEVSAQQLTKK